MSDVVKFNPQAGSVGFAKAAQQMRRPAASTAMVDLLILAKDSGLWVYGPERIEVEEGSQWTIDPDTMCSGFVMWANASPTERMAFVGQPPVDPSTLPPVDPNSEKGWEEQVGFGLICLTGEDAGQKVMYKTNTMGGTEAWNKVFDAMMARVAEGKPYQPIVELEETHYIRKKAGNTVYKPVFRIVGWQGDASGEIEDQSDEVEDDVTEEVEPEKPAPRTRSRKAKEEPEEKPAANGRQRRTRRTS